LYTSLKSFKNRVAKIYRMVYDAVEKLMAELIQKGLLIRYLKS